MEDTLDETVSPSQYVEQTTPLGLRIVSHPDVHRIGEFTFLEEGETAVSRLSPLFGHEHFEGGRPLGTMHVSRQPVVFSRVGGALLIATTGPKLRVDGREVERARVSLGPQGVLVQLGSSVVLWAGPTSVVERSGVLRNLVGWSPGIQQLENFAERVAPTTLPVILEGETGTGKELLAHGLHELSERTGPFVAVNCAAIPEQLAESLLFGHQRGAFSGAEREAAGFFRAADGGTLLLDEIGDLSMASQARLLRALEQRAVTPLGAVRPINTDVRVLAATNSPLSERVERGEFRGDLYARLNGFTLRLPPLRERREDVAALIVHFAQELRGECPRIPPKLITQATLYDWPMNVRELRTFVERAFLMGDGDLALSALPIAYDSASPPDSPATPRRDLSQAEVAQTLEANSFNMRAAAEALGISRQHLYRLAKGFGIRSGSDLRAEEIAAALKKHGGNVAAASRHLAVSERALVLQMSRLGLG